MEGVRRGGRLPTGQRMVQWGTLAPRPPATALTGASQPRPMQAFPLAQESAISCESHRDMHVIACACSHEMHTRTVESRGQWLGHLSERCRDSPHATRWAVEPRPSASKGQMVSSPHGSPFPEVEPTCPARRLSSMVKDTPSLSQTCPGKPALGEFHSKDFHSLDFHSSVIPRSRPRRGAGGGAEVATATRPHEHRGR